MKRKLRLLANEKSMLKIGAGAILSAIGFLVVVFGDRIEQLLAKYREK